MIAASEDAVRGADLDAAVSPERLQTNTQEAVAGLPLDRRIPPRLLRQGLAEQIEKQSEGMRVESAQIRQARRLPGGEALARGLHLHGLLGQLLREQLTGFSAITHTRQRSAGRGLAVLAQTWADGEGRRIRPASAW